MNELIHLDQQITMAINSCHSPYFDNFFWIFTQTYTWIPLLLLFIIIVYRNYGIRPTLFILIMTGLSILFADQISSSLIKPLVQRFRPSRSPEIASMIHTVNGYRGGLYGFCSSHAANTFAFATLTALFFRHRWYAAAFYIWAVITSYSRIYLGVHYLGDIVCGAAVGILTATLLHLSGKTLTKNASCKVIPPPISPIKQRYGNILTFLLIFNICFIAVISVFM